MSDTVSPNSPIRVVNLDGEDIGDGVLTIASLGDPDIADNPRTTDPDVASANIISLLRSIARGVPVIDPVTGNAVQWGDSADEYETVAASQTAQALGATGAIGDYIQGILVIPATTTPGVVTLLDNAISIPLFVGGASSVSNLVPFYIPLGMTSVSGALKITTGANVSVIAIGSFS